MTFSVVLQAQTTYNMSNNSIGDCNGILLDSDGNPITAGDYGHNENFTFTICVPGADSIIMNFSSFCTESGRDVITFYDGPDTLSPMIGIPVSGPSAMPGTIIASSGCLTVHFITDASVSCTGWMASWQSVIHTPATPIIAPIVVPPCGATSITITLDQDLICDSVDASDFGISGPMSPAIISAIPIGCVGGKTRTVQLNFSPALNVNGTYFLGVNAVFVDACGNVWNLSTGISFVMNTCPLSVVISATDTTICRGTCTSLTANILGSVTGVVNYAWSGGIPASAGPHVVCPMVTTTYYVTVTNAFAPPGYDTFTVVVTPRPVLPNDTVLCQSHYAGIPLVASPAGGLWGGYGIPGSGVGWFYPSWVWPSVQPIWYTVNGCSDTMLITVNAASAGSDIAACPGVPPFILSGQNPLGGHWRGLGVIDSITGLFSPVVAGIGTHTLYYTIPGCPDARRNINIDTLTIPKDTSVCDNAGVFNLQFSPYAGVWTGPGIVNWYWGTFDPLLAGPGRHRLLFTMNGCADSMFITVNDVWAGWDRTACPTMNDDTLALHTGASPLGGAWRGVGIIDSVRGIFDPQFMSGANFTSSIYYVYQGCTDTLNIYNYYTDIGIEPLPAECPNDTALLLSWETTQRNLWGGIWNGPGITDSTDYGVFDPTVAGSGIHSLVYSLNGCKDTVLVEVYANASLRDTDVCLLQSPFNIPSNAVVGRWSGAGIINPASGLFNASIAGVGTHTIVFVSANGCKDTMSLTVNPMPVINIAGLATNYCFNDSTVILTATPTGGVWSGFPLINDSIFNPMLAGPGLHSFTYTYGSGDCIVRKTVSTNVYPPLNIRTTFADTTMCYNTQVRIGASGSGGPSGLYNFSWDHALGNGSSHVVNNLSSTVYSVVLSDGCSMPVSGTVQVFVVPPFTFTVATDTMKCYDKGSYATVQILPDSGNYEVIWGKTTIHHTFSEDLFYGNAGRYYSLSMKDLNSGCFEDTSIWMPAFDEVIAHFTPSPNEQCSDPNDPTFEFLDQSQGGTKGIWSFGDGSTSDYLISQNKTHTYPRPGYYQVILSIKNEGECADYMVDTVCVEIAPLITVPTAFSPNQDGVNDRFGILRTRNIQLINEFAIFDRFGVKVFSTNDINQRWDGTYKGRNQPLGAYVWIVKATSYDGILVEEKGQFTLLR